MKRGPITIKTPGANYQIRIVGHRRTLLRDFYHAVLQLPWWATIAGICGAFLLANTAFGVAYMLVGGVVHAKPESFRDAFFFSVQTMGTIGYGALYPEGVGANVVVAIESVTSLTLTALATGLVFAKFSRPTARFVFTRRAVITLIESVPTLTFRLGNERGNQVVDAQIRAVVIRTEKTSEGSTFYRMLDMKLTRERALSLSRSWSVQHPIDRLSPFFGETPASIAAKEIEMQVMVVGLDDITLQPVHASHRYFAQDIVWGARLADVLSETPEGDLLMDLGKFHEVEPTAPSAAFPYPEPVLPGATSDAAGG